ncbi:ABC transporter ATP-binding protein [Cryptosporangium aurantiacum]|uniref:Putative ABC transport system ATP-binding protein n=1 Tax=Cryptosporangium aurantiacum TaxID=134849 RepID=A0A1M7MTF7_9ACTN|nr:ABC transporter ATP-binding protein [Cryptosporangium aurantiacum]SHM94315.1 putative ABC transport system ATP-binding protein [Cryptosporangium aurantiacum]
MTPNAHLETTTATVLTGTDLVRSFGKTPALRGVSCAIRAGEIVAITGPSGSGKSTLLLCLAGVLAPDAGAVNFGGRRIDQLSEAERSRLRRTELGVLFQFGQLVPELTVGENVALPLLLSGARRREALGTASEWLDRFGVADLAQRYPGELSGGQQQRAAVARSLVTEPRVLFADEPTGALDSLAGEQLLTQLTRVARENGTAVLIVTHEAQVAAYAQREITLWDGSVVDDGSTAAPTEAPQPVATFEDDEEG